MHAAFQQTLDCSRRLQVENAEARVSLQAALRQGLEARKRLSKRAREAPLPAWAAHMLRQAPPRVDGFAALPHGPLMVEPVGRRAAQPPITAEVVEQWRKKAVELRAIAHTFHTARAKETYVTLAGNYDLMADQAELMLAVRSRVRASSPEE